MDTNHVTCEGGEGGGGEVQLYVTRFWPKASRGQHAQLTGRPGKLKPRLIVPLECPYRVTLKGLFNEIPTFTLLLVLLATTTNRADLVLYDWLPLDGPMHTNL